jgi:DNA-directed RNA polymerase subunit RPC12/RpoP
MLNIKCAKCKAKIMKYKKIGKGKVLRCWKSRIRRIYDGVIENNSLVCGGCGNVIGELEDGYVKMNQDSFTYTGTKLSK